MFTRKSTVLDIIPVVRTTPLPEGLLVEVLSAGTPENVLYMNAHPIVVQDAAMEIRLDGFDTLYTEFDSQRHPDLIDNLVHKLFVDKDENNTIIPAQRRAITISLQNRLAEGRAFVAGDIVLHVVGTSSDKDNTVKSVIANVIYVIQGIERNGEVSFLSTANIHSYINKQWQEAWKSAYFTHRRTDSIITTSNNELTHTTLPVTESLTQPLTLQNSEIAIKPTDSTSIISPLNKQDKTGIPKSDILEKRFGISTKSLLMLALIPAILVVLTVAGVTSVVHYQKQNNDVKTIMASKKTKATKEVQGLASVQSLKTVETPTSDLTVTQMMNPASLSSVAGENPIVASKTQRLLDANKDNDPIAAAESLTKRQYGLTTQDGTSHNPNLPMTKEEMAALQVNATKDALKKINIDLDKNADLGCFSHE